MSRASPPLLSFNAGELSPRMEGRIDLDKYNAGCKTLDNYLPLVQGGAQKRSGLRFVREVKTTASVTVEIPAVWSEDVLSDGTEFPADGSDDGIGTINIGGNKALRAVQRYPLDDLPAGVTLSQIQVRNNVKVVTNVAAASWIYGRYGAVGQDAEPDAGSTAFTRADASVMPYLSGDIAFRTTGSKTVDITGAQVKTDLAACKAGGFDFSLAIRETSESVASVHNVSLSEYIEGVNAPTLILSYVETRARLIPFEFSTEQAYQLEFGEQYMRVYKDGGIVLETPLAITATTNATPVVVTIAAHGYANNDEVLIQGTGIAALDNRYWVIAGVTTNTFELVGSTAPGSAATLGTASAIYEITTPYHAADVGGIAYAQSADVMYLVHPLYEPRKLSRTGHTAWTLVVVPFDWQPFAPENIVETDWMVASADTGSVTITSTGGHFTADHVGSYVRLREVIEVFHAEWKADEDYDSATYAAFRSGTTGNPGTGIQPGDRLQYQGRVYELTDEHSDANTGTVPPVHEDGFANDGRHDHKFINYGSGYALITAFTDAFRVTATVVKTFPRSMRRADQAITGITAANPIQITVTAHGSETGDSVFIRGLSGTFGSTLNNQVFVITKTGANTFTIPVNGTGLVGGVGGVIVRVASGGTYTATVVDSASVPAFPSLFRWSFGAWSAERGYPRAVSFFEDRLFFAGTDADPQTLWGSRSGRYEDFRETDEDDSALVLTLNTNKVNVIEWLVGQEQLLIGTSGGEFQLAGGGAGGIEPVTPGNVRATQRSTYGCRAGVLPIAIEGPVLFVQRAGRKIRELVPDLDTSFLVGQDMTVLADHITLGLVKQLAFQSEPNRILWVILEDGSLRGFTYERAQQVTGWHRHSVGGVGAAVESISVIPHPDGDQDQLWAIVRRTIGGTPRRYVEFLEQEWLRTQLLPEAFFLDSGLTYLGSAATVIGGLFHLIGESVYALADGLVVGPFTVSAAGTITLSVAATQVHVGLLYTGVLETMRVEAGAQDGTAQGKTKSVKGLVLRLDQTGEGLFYGPSSATATQPLQHTPGTIFDGDSEWQSFPGGLEREGRIAVLHSAPTPCTITAILPKINTEDR